MRSSTVVNVMPGWRDMSDGVVHLRDQQAETQILGSTFFYPPLPGGPEPSPKRKLARQSGSQADLLTLRSGGARLCLTCSGRGGKVKLLAFQVCNNADLRANKEACL